MTLKIINKKVLLAPNVVPTVKGKSKTDLWTGFKGHNLNFGTHRLYKIQHINYFLYM